jgi:hypothetical protein
MGQWTGTTARTCRLFSDVRSARYVAGRPARCCRYTRWIPMYVIHIYYLFAFLYNSNCVK